MTEKSIDKLKGQYCKVVIDEPGKEKATVIYGYLKDVDHKKNFVVLDFSDGLVIVNKKSIVAIKPSNRKK